MKKEKNLVAVSEGTGIGVEELTAVPSLGQMFTYLNNGELDNPEFLTSRGFDILSIKTSDIRFTFTLGEKETTGGGYSTNTAVDFRNNQMFPKSNVVVAFRFKGNNFFIKNNNIRDLYNEMYIEIRSRFDEQAKLMGKTAAAHIRTLLRRRLASGTCFMIKDLVVVERETGACTWWQHSTKSRKVTLSGYKEAVAARGYTKPHPENSHMWKRWAGKLWVNDCVCVLDKKEDFVCAYRSRQHK